MNSETPGDLTPEVGAETDVAPLGRTLPKPAHERTAAEDRIDIDWHGIAATTEFKELLKAKARFIVPTTVFFVAYYFALPVLVGFFPKLMETKVFGKANAAYLFALSQFFVAWAIAFAYTRTASRWDRMAEVLLAKFRSERRP
jgi:uncharacterized membrane protein (DUF485 family)